MDCVRQEHHVDDDIVVVNVDFAALEVAKRQGVDTARKDLLVAANQDELLIELGETESAVPVSSLFFSFVPLENLRARADEAYIESSLER